RLIAFSKKGTDSLSLYLEAVDLKALPSGLRRFVEYSITIVNQTCEELSVRRERRIWFDKNTPNWGWPDMISLFNLTAPNSGFLVNGGGVMVIAEVEALEVIDTLNPSQVAEISEDRAHDYSSSSDELQNKDDVAIEVNGFQVLHSQVTQVKAIFEKHPDLTSNFSLKNQQIKNAYMYALLDLIKTLCKAPKELTVEDLNKADNMLSDLIKAGFNLDWLRQKLDQGLDKQIAYDTRIRELEKQVKKRKLALTELEGDLEKEKAAASVATIFSD
ncbi:hypothetical protein EUTSA_v10006470mg, partial [Eutrema salsugineum]